MKANAKAKACFALETGFRKIQFSANYSQHDAHSAQVAQDEQSPHAQVAQHVFTQHDLASETSAFCGAKLSVNKIAEKRMMNFIARKAFVVLEIASLTKQRIAIATHSDAKEPRES